MISELIFNKTPSLTKPLSFVHPLVFQYTSEISPGNMGWSLFYSWGLVGIVVWIGADWDDVGDWVGTAVHPIALIIVPGCDPLSPLTVSVFWCIRGKSCS